jgi:hypothetical protein
MQCGIDHLTIRSQRLFVTDQLSWHACPRLCCLKSIALLVGGDCGHPSLTVKTYYGMCRFRFRYVLHPFAAKYSHWMWH